MMTLYNRIYLEVSPYFNKYRKAVQIKEYILFQPTLF